MPATLASVDVIIADDDLVIRNVLRSKLEAINQTVLLAPNGLKAVQLAEQTRVKLILLDLAMPQLNGLLACQRIRQIPHHAQTPIVILTSVVGKDAEEALTRVGATAFLAKPFRSGQLLQVLSRYLANSEGTQREINCAADRVAEIARNRARVNW